ncbi:uncharacterized protein LOC122069856 [Macadamia integrifolia]|uniref:uncharacterized protein LOC122069856 n=1 Tax=Macadamia integrifolia TaxID=60698 RepID=UPI001C4E6F10|nr:uncharacterized protein LOC122069856 [Macadamia integrifolia]
MADGTCFGQLESVKLLNKTTAAHNERLNSLRSTITVQQQSTLRINPSSPPEISFGCPSTSTLPLPHTTQPHTTQTRAIPLDFPRFNGIDPVGWIFKAEHFFDYHGAADDQRLLISSLHMDGPALWWFQGVLRVTQFTTWPDFTQALESRFGISKFKDPQDTLPKPTQSALVADQQSRIEASENLSPPILSSHFISRPRSDILSEVLALQSSSMSQAVGLVHHQEEKFLEVSRPALRTGIPTVPQAPFLLSLALPPSTDTQSYPRIPKSLEVGRPVLQTSIHTIPRPPLPPFNSWITIQYPTSIEMHPYREKGLCYNDGEKFAAGHKCKPRQLFLLVYEDDALTTNLLGEDSSPGHRCKSRQLFLLLYEGDSPTMDLLDEDSSTYVEPFISVVLILYHAMSGHSSPSTLWLSQTIVGTPMQVQINGGSVDFVQGRAAQCLGLVIEPAPNINVLVGNSDCNSKGIERNLPEILRNDLQVPRQRRDVSQLTTHENGFCVGFKGSYVGRKAEKYFINNHSGFRVMYHKNLETASACMVGFEVAPISITHLVRDTKNIIKGKKMVFTHDVSFKLSEFKWATHWDTYLLMNDDQIHWFSVINFLMIFLFFYDIRTLCRDIANYNQLETKDEAQEETAGWELVHGNVFRPPVNSGLLCFYVGTWVQIFGMTLVPISFALLGFLSPLNRRRLKTTMVLLWVFMGLIAGYSAHWYKMFKGAKWKRNTLKATFIFHGILFSILFALNALIWGEQFFGALPFGTMFALAFLWLGISVPLVFVGNYLGFKSPAIKDPTEINKIPIEITKKAWYMKPAFSILIGGILPFGAMFVEICFILTSIWLNQFYYIFSPLQALDNVVKVACKLDLSAMAKSCLKQRDCEVRHVLVHWGGLPWKRLNGKTLRSSSSPHSNLEDKVLLEEDGNVTTQHDMEELMSNTIATTAPHLARRNMQTS